MKKAEWGPLVWKVLHCMTIKIKDEEFQNERENIIQMISGICSNLPCPQCATHASGLIKKHKLRDVKSKIDIIKFIYLMHNQVNKRLKKQIYSFEKIEEYEHFNMKSLLNDYYNMNLKAKYNEKMMLHSYHRKTFMKKFCDYFRNNISKFNQ